MAETPSTMLALGTRAPDFSLPDIVSGREVAPDDFAGRKALLVMFISRPSVYDRDVEDPLRAELIIAKQRNGPIGEIDLVFQHEFTRFENADFSHQDGDAPW